MSFFALRRLNSEDRATYLQWQIVASVGVALLLGGFLIFAMGERTVMNRDARVAWMAACQDGGEPEAKCERRMDAEDVACFKRAYSSGGRYEDASVDTALYIKCVRMGFDAWMVEHRKELQGNSQP